jgi:tetratricopeptide (TPR) repeat protein
MHAEPADDLANPGERRQPSGMASATDLPADDADQLTEDGHRFLDGYADSGDEEDLRRALTAYERALEVLPPGEETWPFLSNLGNCLRVVHEEFDDAQALTRAVNLLEEASVHVSPGTADYALVLDNLALALRDRFAITTNAADLGRAVDLHVAAVDAYGDGPELSRYLNNLGGACWELHRHTGDQAHLERATTCFEASVAATPDDSPDRSRQLSNLALALADQHRSSRDVTLLDRALDAARAALAVPGADVTDRGRMLSGLAGLLLERFDAQGGLADLDEAIGLLRAAVADASPHPRRYAMWLNNLGEALLGRFEQTGVEADLDESVDAFECAVRLAAENRPGPGRFQAGLGGALGTRYMLRGDLADLNRGIELTAAAVASIPAEAEAATFAANRKHSLGTLLRQRYETRGDIADLEAAARWFRESAELTPPDSPAMARRQAAIGDVQRDIYERTGEFWLLDDAINRYRRALAIAGPEAPARATYLDKLGMAQLDRYERTGGIDDLDESVRFLRMARAATPTGAEAFAGVLNNLGVVLWNRHVHRPTGSDLDEALDLFGHAIKQTAPGAPDIATYLDNLANALGDRYQATGDIQNLDRAVSAYERALVGLADDAPGRLRIATNIAACLLTRYRDEGAWGGADARDLGRAVEILQKAVVSTPPGAPALISRLNSLGVGLKYRFLRHQDAEDLDQGRAALSRASGPEGAHDVRWSLAAALTLAGWAGERGDWDEAADAYRAAMATAEDYLRVQLVRGSTEAALRRVDRLYADAAHALGRTGQPSEAAAAVERGRAVLLSEALGHERALAGLLATTDRAEVTALAERFQRASSRVRELTGLARSRGEFLASSS